jgi:hypothetical protein
MRHLFSNRFEDAGRRYPAVPQNVRLVPRLIHQKGFVRSSSGVRRSWFSTRSLGFGESNSSSVLGPARSNIVLVGLSLTLSMFCSHSQSEVSIGNSLAAG